ncbi:hypothetical protein H9L01_03855 [Erysipelothrix inopinata]|uniref:Uncharacterized protein n=1 Tax=Erysipelothrix inopinata TaxID=225084 RepID=A0A7G9S0Y0_9FIRM|nr:hypothetical protein [Erysipelothrix inopinata]QNN61505.1 hypothetical protein H9L01_03855 [Erysipelothrix inopinata]
MVIKLTKQEIIETTKAFIPVAIMTVVGGLITLLIGTRLRYMFDAGSSGYNAGIWELIFPLGFLAIFVLLIASGVLMFMMVIRILYQSIYKQNSYRFFTYPVTSRQLFFSKILTTLFWSVVSYAMILGVFLIAITLSVGDLSLISGFFGSMGEAFAYLLGGKNVLGHVLVALQGLITNLRYIVFILFAGSIANSSYIRKNRAFMTFLIYMGLVIVTSILYGIVGVEGITFTSTGDLSISNVSLSIQLLSDLIMIVIASFGTIWFWDHKLEVLN